MNISPERFAEEYNRYIKIYRENPGENAHAAAFCMAVLGVAANLCSATEYVKILELTAGGAYDLNNLPGNGTGKTKKCSTKCIEV